MKKIGLLLIALFLCISCSKKEKGIKRENMINMSINAPVRSLDPRIAIEDPIVHVINMIYEGLMRLGPHGEVDFGVAKSVDVSEDKKRYTFHLRDSYWSNGDPVTAYDFEYAWKKSVNPLYSKGGAHTFYVIKNAQACVEKKVDVDDVGVKALDEKTLTVELEYPIPYFLSLCAVSTFSPIHCEIDKKNPQWANDVGDHFVTNGPFALSFWKKGDEIVFRKNPKYWDSNHVQIDGIRILIVSDPHTQYLMYEKGELNYFGVPMNSSPVDVVEGILQKDELVIVDTCGVYWYFMNTEKPPFNNKNFRKAVAYAINRKELAENIFPIAATPATGILNGILAVSKDRYFEDGNVDLAKKYLDLALQEMGATLDEINPIVISQTITPIVSRVNQAVQQQLHDRLGLVIDIRQAEWPVYYDNMMKGNFTIGGMAWRSWITDPIYMLNTFRNKSVQANMSRWENPLYQQLLESSDCEIDQAKRTEYLHQAEELLMEDMAVIPLCFYKYQRTSQSY